MKRYIRCSQGFKPWTKSDFEIKSRPYGGRLQGQENLYAYYITDRHDSFYKDANGNQIIFFKKADAIKWLGRFIKEANAKRKEAYEDGIYEIVDLRPVQLEEEFYIL